MLMLPTASRAVAAEFCGLGKYHGNIISCGQIDGPISVCCTMLANSLDNFLRSKPKKWHLKKKLVNGKLAGVS